MSPPGAPAAGPAGPGGPVKARPTQRLRLFATLFLVAGLPIVLVVAVYLREIKDLRAQGRTNPLGGVADTLMDRVETRVHTAQDQVRTAAADPDLAGPGAAEALARYDPLVRSGHFRALALALADGRRLTLPEALPAAWAALVPVPAAEGVFELSAHPDGVRVIAITAALGAPGPGGWVTGLLDVSAVLGESVLDRMRVARWGHAFLVDGEGRIFLSADRALVGRSLGDLGLAPTAGREGVFVADGWREGGGEPHYVALAPAHGYYEGPQNGWRAGLMVPESVVSARSGNMAAWVVAAVVIVLAVTAGLLLVLRHSLRGAPPR